MNKIFNIQTHMDFVGQQRSEKYSRFIITLFGIIGLIYGGIVQQFSLTVYSLGIGFILACVLTIPPWPIYRRNPLKWQKAIQQRQNLQNASEETKHKKKK